MAAYREPGLVPDEEGRKRRENLKKWIDSTITDLMEGIASDVNDMREYDRSEASKELLATMIDAEAKALHAAVAVKKCLSL